MIIFRSIKSNWITQRFSENKSPIYRQKFEMEGHNGTDFFLYEGEPVYFDCDCAGKVIATTTDEYGGLGVEIVTEDTEGLLKHRYWHLKGFACRAGQIVETGDLLGFGDNTGLSSANHLHRDMKQVEKDRYGNYITLNKDNGYKGCINIEPFFENEFVLRKMQILSLKVWFYQIFIKVLELKILATKFYGR